MLKPYGLIYYFPHLKIYTVVELQEGQKVIFAPVDSRLCDQNVNRDTAEKALQDQGYNFSAEAASVLFEVSDIPVDLAS
jgi:type II secretory pathway component GspD/PulD (secretin)